MEWDIVFSQEVKQLDMLGILPPLFPVAPLEIVSICVGLGDARVPNASVKPHVEHLGRILFGVQPFDLGDWHTPFQVACDGAGLQALVDP